MLVNKMRAIRVSKNQKGFSLVELMIVVAIIGILSAIAVPNFQRFQRKARQAEAKANVTGYYSAAKASMAEWGSNTGNFVAVGYQPEGALNYRITAVNGPVAPGTGPTEPACVVTTAACNVAVPAFKVWTEQVPSASSGPAASATAASNTGLLFVTTASGRIGTALIDTWTINQAKAITNPVSGL